MTKHDETRNPFFGVMDFFSEMNRAWDQATGRIETQQERRSHLDAWTPRLDILTKGDDLVIRCAVPGAHADDIEVTYVRSQLTITGTVAFAPEDDERADYYTRELHHGRFRRILNLTAEASEQDLTVQLHRGVLEITVPDVTASPRPRVQISEH